MRFLIDTENKKVLVLEILFGFIALLLVIGTLYLFLNPPGKAASKRDQARKDEINSIFDGLQKYLTQDDGSNEFVNENIELCVNGWTEIGNGEERVNLKSVLANYTTVDFIDPTIALTEDYSGYDICRNIEADRYIIRASKAEFELISISKKLDLGKN